MNNRLTDDEKFLLALAENTKPGEGADPFYIGSLVSMSERRVQAISVQLIRTNFLRRCDNDQVVITDHGRRLVENLPQ